MIRVEVWKKIKLNKNPNPIIIYKVLPQKTIIDIPITFSYIRQLQHVEFGP